MVALEMDVDGIAAACRHHGVRQLDLFGSATTGAFDPIRSDVDLVVSFLSEDWQGRSDRYFGLLAALEGVFGRTVDLIEEGAVRNPYLRAEIERSRRTVFPAS